MNPNSKPTLVTALILHALLLIIPASAWAAAEDGQEIGVPQFKEPPRVKECFGAVLSPDEDYFYTLREGYLHKYKIKPFKNIGSIAIDREQLEENRRDSRCRILITNDKSKLIVIYSYRMYLLDISTGQVLSKFEKRDWGRGMDAAAVNGNELLLFEYDSDDNREIGVSIWDANTLKLKSEIRDLGKRFGFFQDRQLMEGMSKHMDRIYLATAESVVILNSKTYAPELTLLLKSFRKYPAISKNSKNLYVWNVIKVTDHLSGKHASYEDAKSDNVLVFDYEKMDFSIENANSPVREELDPILVFRARIGQVSRNKNYLMLSPQSDRASASLINLKTGARFSFQQYESSEAILSDRDKYFEITPRARKYLEMKTATRVGDSINDATFNKYHRRDEANPDSSPVRAVATAEEAKEIGIPQVMESPAKGCFSAVLSPDSDRFYTVREGVLTQYKMNPLQKIDSVVIDREQLNEGYDVTWCRVLITNDKSKLIIVYKAKIFLLALPTGKVLNRFEKTFLHVYAAILNEEELLIFNNSAAYQFNLTILDTNTLELNRDLPHFGRHYGFDWVQDFSPGMSKIRDRIYLTGLNSVVVLNSKTYKPELSIALRPDSNVPSFGQPKLSRNFQKLHVGKVSVVTDHLNGKRTSFDEFKFSSVLVFDLESREFRIEDVNSIKRDKLDPLVTHPDQLSRNKRYVLVSGLDRTSLDSEYILRYETFLRNLSTGVQLSFRQFDSGEAILYDQNNYFQLTPGARKYLMMENHAGKIVPINDATFTKYHRAEYAHLKWP